MELFAAAGIDLPPYGGGGKRAGAAVRTLRVPLFSHKVVKEARELAAFAPSNQQMVAAADYAKKVRNAKFLKQKETAVRSIFIDEVFRQLLGYTTFHIEDDYTLVFEEQIRRGSVDVALGKFSSAQNRNDIIAPFELKGPDTGDLDRIMPGRGRSPVQQAWDYAIDAPGSRWVLVSNCVEIRLYGFGRGRDAYELFDLSRLDDPEEFARLWQVLSAPRFLGGLTDKLLRDTDEAYKDVTNVLYKDYKSLRDRLIAFLVDSSDGPRLASLKAIEVAQKTLDRILFIAFAERTDLLPEKLLERASKAGNDFIPQPIWKNFLSLFRAVDKGSDRLLIPGYNGGLFAQDDVADTLILPDELAKDVAKLGQWDYKREVPVTVLGHIFEQSITDLEKLKAESRGEAPPDVSKRKRDGVVYTPDMVTRFLVEQTIVRTLDERLARLKAVHDMATEEGEKALWNAYLTDLRSLTIVDPACGSGAFLVAAFDELARQYRSVTERLKEMGETIDFDVFDEIVTKNLYGVDLNAESVEITRLALWLKTARRHHKLQNLEDTIKVGNSLIEDKVFTPRPFNWRMAFPEVFANGGFDIVLGNPPYVRSNLIADIKPYLRNKFEVFEATADLYCYFYEVAKKKILNQSGRIGFISSCGFFKTSFGNKLRQFIDKNYQIECCVDFGDFSVFEGVTTYPIAIVMNSRIQNSEYEIKSMISVTGIGGNLIQEFNADSFNFPRTRLSREQWHFERENNWKVRDKIESLSTVKLSEIAKPISGIKTGSKHFIINKIEKNRILKNNPNSINHFRNWITGDNLSKWHIENSDESLLFLPKGWTKENYDAENENEYWSLVSKDHDLIATILNINRENLSKRSDKGDFWWELRSCDYYDLFERKFICYPEMSQGGKFSLSSGGAILNNKCFMIDTDKYELLSYLNSKLAWFLLFGICSNLRGGIWRLELRADYLQNLPLPNFDNVSTAALATLGETCTTAARERYGVQCAVQHRLLDLAGPDRRKLTGKLEEWHNLDFKAFMAEIKKAFRAEIPLKQRGEWEAYLAENAAVVNAHSATIAAAECEIDTIVYALFDLTQDEIALLETSLQGQY